MLIILINAMLGLSALLRAGSRLTEAMAQGPSDKSMQTTTSPQRTMQKATPPMPPASVDAGAINVRLKTEDLFAGSREIALLHNGREYRLRITQQGKLLLTA
jgi:hemin uptake protein HemP